MNFAAMLIVGILAGLFVSVLTKRRGLGIIVQMLVGLVGAFVGGFFVGKNIEITSSLFANVLITATVGAFIFLFVLSVFSVPNVKRRYV